MNKKSVLIVDDEAGIRESMTGIFEDEGFAVMTAASGEEALERIAEKMPDLVFLDVWLPEMDGIETLERLKEQKYNLPVVMMSWRVRFSRKAVQFHRAGHACSPARS